jgi:pre-mRNA-splicing factor CWC22
MAITSFVRLCCNGLTIVRAAVPIEDKTEIDVIGLRRTIYLTIMSSLDFEETVHKLMKLNIPDGQEHEVINMVLECCSQVCGRMC